MAHPGGCQLGSRPVDLHLKVLRAMGVAVGQADGRFTFQLQRRLQGASVRLEYPSVGATCMFLLAAAAADGPSVLENAACEPEVGALAWAVARVCLALPRCTPSAVLQVQDLARMLSCMGARVVGAGTGHVCVQPPQQLGGCDYTIMPDRIEAGTFMTAAAMTASRLSIEPVIPSHLLPVTQALRAAGCSVRMVPMADRDGCVSNHLPLEAAGGFGHEEVDPTHTGRGCLGRGQPQQTGSTAAGPRQRCSTTPRLWSRTRGLCRRWTCVQSRLEASRPTCSRSLPP